MGRVIRFEERGVISSSRAASDGLVARYDFGRILHKSVAMERAITLAHVAAQNDLPVVLLGESGTGKELFAHAVHAGGARSVGPFVAVNCGSIPSQLIESELFGYEPGAFTNARREGSPGRFEDAHGGTLFLDEVSELSGPAQTALLRVLQEKEIVRVGGSRPRPVDVRVVAATNKPLEDEITASRFRRDLYYRLNVLRIVIPALRDRREDVVLLAKAFLAEAERQVGRIGLSFTERALAALLQHAWPGNVRELQNAILRAAATATGPAIDAADLLLDPVAGPAPREPDESCRPLLPKSVQTLRAALLQALEECRWNVAQAAARLGVSRMTMYRRLRRCGISRRDRRRG